MKNLIKILLLSLMVVSMVASWVSCNKNNKLKKEIQEAYVEFSTAYTTGDYVKARVSLAKVESLNDMIDDDFTDRVYDKDDIYDMKSDLFRAEAAEIIAMGTPNSAARIVILIKQDAKTQWQRSEMCTYVMDEGMRARNTELVRSAYLINIDSRKAFDTYLNYISTLAPVEAIALLEEVKLLGLNLTPGLNGYYAGRENDERYEYNGWSYSQSIIGFNRTCTHLIRKSLSNGNKDVAGQILSLMHQNMDITMGAHEKTHKGIEVDGNHCYIEYTSRDIDAARSLIENIVPQASESESLDNSEISISY
jgi:hypothetical protein